MKIWIFLVFVLVPSLNAEETTLNLTTLNFDLVPKEMLCTMCHTVLSKFQDKLQHEPEKFKEEMLASCSMMDGQEAIDKCRHSFAADHLQKLREKSALVLCREQQLCRPDEKPKELEDNQTIPQNLGAIPDVEVENKPTEDVKQALEVNDTTKTAMPEIMEETYS